MSLSVMNSANVPHPDVARLAAMASVFPGPFGTLFGLPGAEADDLTVEEVRLSLLCPLSLRRIQDLPVRGRDCTHYETFEGKTFLTLLAASSGSGCGDAPCPHCRNRLRATDLVKCGFTLGVLRSEKLPRDATHVSVRRDLTWEPEPPRKSPDAVEAVDEEPACNDLGSIGSSSRPARVTDATAPDTPAKDLKRAKELIQRYAVTRPKESRAHRAHPYSRPGTENNPSKTVWEETKYLQTRHWDPEQDERYPEYYEEESWEQSDWIQSWYEDEPPPCHTGSAFSWSRGLKSLFG